MVRAEPLSGARLIDFRFESLSHGPDVFCLRVEIYFCLWWLVVDLLVTSHTFCFLSLDWQLLANLVRCTRPRGFVISPRIIRLLHFMPRSTIPSAKDP